LVNTGKVPLDKIITDSYELVDAPKAFYDFAHNPGNMLKVSIHIGDPVDIETFDYSTILFNRNLSLTPIKQPGT